MPKLALKEGTTSKLTRVFIQDTSVTDGSGLTGLVYNSSGLTAYYLPEGDASATQITLASMTVGTWASGGFKEVDATNMPGVYEIGLPNAVIDATSEGSVVVMLKGATNMAPVLMEIELDALDYRDSVRAGLTALPNADAGSAGGLPTDSTGKTAFNDLDAAGVRSAVGLASANLDTQFSSIGTDFLATVLTKGSAGTIERAFWQTLKIAALTDGEIAGTPTASAFDTNLTNTSGAFDHLLLVFVSGALEGEARPIESYVSTNGRIVLQEALTAAPAVADEFVIVPDHSEPSGDSAADQALLKTTTIATLTSQTVFTLTAGSSDDNAYNGCTIVVTDAVTSEQKCVGIISDYIGSTKTVTLKQDPQVFTIAEGDSVAILVTATNATVATSSTSVGWLG